MQFWPRVRASRSYARVRNLPTGEAKPLVFAGYKAGMTHIMGVDSGKTSLTKGEKVAVPVTVIECPPMKIASVRFYKPSGYGVDVAQELFFQTNKELSRKITAAKKQSTAKDIEAIDLSSVSKVTIQVYTQPHKTGIGKKKPEIFEVGIGGSVEEQVNYVKENVGKEIAVSDLFAAGNVVDARAVTTGRGYQGPVKRFGISLRAKKSEKTKRGPGSLGGWIAQGHTLYRIAHAGQTGFHQRTQYNNLIVEVGDDIAKVNPKGGFINYGNVKSTYVLIKGSLPGPKKRLVTLTAPLRPHNKVNLPTVQQISIASKQGN